MQEQKKNSAICKRTWPYFSIYQDKSSHSESKERKGASRKFVWIDVHYTGSKRQREREREKKEKNLANQE
jgi:hypothetical protein